MFARGVALVFLLASCGSTIGQIPFSGEGEGQTVVQVRAGELRFWTELDAQFRGEMHAQYDVELTQDGAVVGTATCHPLQLGPSRVCSKRILVGETHVVHCRMACNVVMSRPGPTLVRARFSIASRPADLRLSRANLVVKQ
jgi:hypothetical protein